MLKTTDEVAPICFVPVDAAYQVVEEMNIVAMNDNGFAKIYTGRHPKLGMIHVVIMPMGDSLILDACA